MRDVAVKVEDLSYAYSQEDGDILSHCSWSIPYGCIALLEGTSGSGKSTLLSCITGLAGSYSRSSISGTIVIDGLNIADKEVQEIARHIGYVQQNPNFQILNESVDDEIAFGCENLNMSASDIVQQISKYCGLLELNPVWNTLKISGGQQERVCCAAALAMERPVMVFDEPLANLDRSGVRIVMDALRDLADLGHTIIVCEHRVQDVLSYADQVATLSNGKLEVRPHNRQNADAEGSAVEQDEAAKQCEYLEQRESFEQPETQIQHHIVENREILNHPTGDDNTEHCPGHGEGTGNSAGQNYSRAARTASSLGKQADADSLLLRLDHIEVVKRKRVLLQVNSLEIHRNEFVLLLGENGCGKSTLLSLLSGVLKPTRGAMVDSTHRKIRLRKGIRCAHLWQNPDYQLFTTSVFDELLARNKDEAACMQMLERIGLAGKKNKHPLALSEGQKRRLVFAGCLLSEPDLLLLDEPSAGQDAEHLFMEMDLLQEYRQQHSCACMMATHDSREANAFAERVLIMHRGEIVNDGGAALARRWFTQGD